MRVFDCFTFFNELDLLKIRCEILKELNPIHVLVEAPITHTGDEKPLYFFDNWKEFEQYNIIHVCAHLPNDGNPWNNENAQRDQIMYALDGEDMQDDDIIIVSDLDEIPRPETIRQFDADKMLVAALKMDKFSYYLNCLECSQGWESAKVTSWKHLKTTTPQRLRVGGFKTIMLDAGWHWSWLGGVDKIMEKFYAYAHTESVTSKNADPELLKEKLETGESIWSQGNKNDKWKFMEIDDYFPEYIRNNDLELTAKGLIKLL